MTTYVATVHSKKSAEEIFDYLIDLRNLEEWDPGVSSAKLVDGTQVGPEGEFDVKANGSKLRYKIVKHDKPDCLGFRAKTRFLESIDYIYITDQTDHTKVVYDAKLLLNGVLSPLSPLLKPIFNRIGDKAAVGLAKYLDGELIS